MKSWGLAAAVVVALGVGLLATLLLRDDERATSADDDAGPKTATSQEPATEGGASPTPTRAASYIEMSSSTYFGRPFETIQIQGRYRGAPGPTRLRLQIQQSGGWTQYPLPAVTKPSGEFRAFVEVGDSGSYPLRVVDAQRKHVSEVVTLLVF